MIQGTLKWTSSGKEFGLVMPDNGGRDIFMRMSPATASSYTSDGQGGLEIKSTSTTAQTRHQVASRVEVRTRYQEGQWAGGYEIAQVVELGYRLRRPGALDLLPDVFVSADVRAGD